ncbi:uncharacterized protein LOC121972563 [Zingiber officinale]|uniref:uncharacterized protein LOC121972563 n=1 Tax=Zingiber officinale TaxID=94328 RepID=UPI001C4C9EB3|nr:uncharacterized protein LOC121972563 [Zingiber officinale]
MSVQEGDETSDAIYSISEGEDHQQKAPIPYNPSSLVQEQQAYINWAETEMARLKQEVEAAKALSILQMEQLKKEFQRREEELIRNASADKLEADTENEELRLKDEEIQGNEEAYMFVTEGREKELSTSEVITSKRKTNGLFNLIVELSIPGVKSFKVNAILDTGVTTCCIDQASITSEAIEDNTFIVNFSGINSKTTANKKLKYGSMRIGEHTFWIPYTYAFPLTIGGNITMIIGCNFIRSLYGGIRIEGDEVTFYKNITTIKTQQTIATTFPLEELELEEEEYHQIQEQICTWRSGTLLQDLIKELTDTGYIRDDPTKHWAKNKITCRLEIKNPDLVIEDRPLKHVTPQMQKSFSTHIKALLKLKVIQPSTSRHRTIAIIVHSGTTVDPVTGKEIKGKEHMVFNYKCLNDNTHKDQYSLPGINTIINKVSMHPESVPWTAFWVPDGLYEWLVMPFGLKNAPVVFQRKMDNCFKGTEDFIAVYIDDILVFSESEQEHRGHLKILLDICKKNGLILSPTKMKLGSPTIEFLGATIGESKIKLQTHIITKIVDFSDQELQTTKGFH